LGLTFCFICHVLIQTTVFIVDGFAGIDGMFSEVLSLGLSGSSSRGQNIYQNLTNL